MALSWAQARDKIRADLWKSATVLPDDVVDRGLHSALLEIESARRWLFLETVRLSDVFYGSQINLPSDCGAISTLTIIRPGGTSRDVLSNEHIDRVRFLSQNGSGGGWPSVYARTSDDIFLDCEAPDGSRFEIVYTFKTPEDVSVASAAVTNVTLQKQEGAVLGLACGHLASTRLKNETEAARHFGIYERMLIRMIDQDDGEREDHYGPSILPDTGYYQMAHGG